MSRPLFGENTLITLVDGGGDTDVVIDHASWIAGKTGQSISLVHGLGRHTTKTQEDFSGRLHAGARSSLLDAMTGADTRDARAISDRGASVLDRARARLNDRNRDIVAHLRRDDAGDIASEIAPDGSMIILGRHTSSNNDTNCQGLGHTAEEVLRTSRVPVYVATGVPDDTGPVMVAYDGSDASEKAVDFIAASRLFSDRPIEMVSVGSGLSIETRLDIAGARLKDAGYGVTTRTLDGNITPSLCDRARTAGATQIVLGARGHGHVHTFFLGSTSMDVIAMTGLPVLVVR